MKENDEVVVPKKEVKADIKTEKEEDKDMGEKTNTFIATLVSIGLLGYLLGREIGAIIGMTAYFFYNSLITK